MKNYCELTHTEKNVIHMDIKDRCWDKSVFTYYINNCIACATCPLMLWSFVCDLIYWNECHWYIFDIDVVWYYVNAIYYSNERDNKTQRSLFDSLIKYIAPKKEQARITNISSKYFRS
jgi:hypothetical protein